MASDGQQGPALFTLRDARESDLPSVDFMALGEGMDRMPGIERMRVAVNDADEVVGFLRLQPDAQGVAYVNPVVVYPTWRGQGVGRALMDDAHERAGELRLIARGTSVGFYRKLGFTNMSWADTDQSAASEDCDGCPYRVDCKPQPMRLV